MTLNIMTFKNVRLRCSSQLNIFQIIPKIISLIISNEAALWVLNKKIYSLSKAALWITMLHEITEGFESEP